jgi:tetratricopeptide (TPR) repeat protein
MQGWSFLNKPASRQNNIEARRLFERSLAIDEKMTSSLVGLAYVYVGDFDLSWSSTPQADLDHAAGLINRALAIDAKMAIAYRAQSWIYSASSRIPEAIAAAETAIALNRNDSMSYSILALALLQSGEAERSRLAGERALMLSPRDPNLWAPLSVVARAQLLSGENEAALANLRKAALANPAASLIRLNLAGAYGRMGRDREAREAIGEFLRMVPDLMEGRPESELTIIRAQIELAARGYYFGTADGVIGIMSRRALADFQHAQGLAKTCEFDAATLARLGIT